MRQVIHGIVITLGAAYVLFLPGFVLSFLFFKRDEKDVDIIERLALSFALSVAVVPLIAFYLNLLGVKISRLSVLLEVLGIVIASLIGVWIRNRPKLSKHKSKHYEIDPRR